MSRFSSRCFVPAIVVVLLGGPVLLGEEPTPTPAVALDRLKAGNDRFAGDKPTAKVDGVRRAELAKGQHPFAVILTCADSRVAPELVFDQGLGDLFVLRVAGNIADRAVIGSIEYAIEHLHAPLIVVLGHESCGAVAAALDGKALPGDLGWLVKQVHVGDQLPECKQDRLAAGIQANVLHAAGELKQRSSTIKEFVATKRVQIVPGVYSLKSGKVEWLKTKAEKE
jgi:carbonic anhydrase